ncbi:MAG: SIMPL domain-containing protein, partial [Rhodoferax sp.]|nr:SIMPL domain-containing protein [Rhodoferax sp.]
MNCPNHVRRLAAALAFVLVSVTVHAQQTALPVPQNQVQLSASAAVDVPQDLLTMTMNTVRDGPDAATVQNQLKVALESALLEARKSALPGQMDVR